MLGLRRGSVSVGAIPTLAPYLLPPVLAAFARAWPGIAVNVREDLTNALLAQLVDGELDLALLSLPVRRPDVLGNRYLARRCCWPFPPGTDCGGEAFGAFHFARWPRSHSSC